MASQPRTSALLLELVGADNREGVSIRIAERLGVERIVLFVRDEEVDVFLPASGFPQRLPDGLAWREFLTRCAEVGEHRGELRSPHDRELTRAFGIEVADGVSAVLLGGEPNREELANSSDALALAGAFLRQEHAAITANAKASSAERTAQETSDLLASLEISRKQLQAAMSEVQAARADAEQTIRLNEIFAGVLGHDLRNPLSAIMTAAYLVLRQVSDEKSIKPLNRILSSGERMNRMISQLLDFTRVRVAGGLSLHRRELDLHDLSSRILNELEDASPEWTVRLEAVGYLHGEWDEDRISQVLSNLAGNAFQHGSKNAPLVVRLDGTDKNSVQIEFRNEGTIPPEILPILFEPFRGSQHHGLGGSRGLGLGLFIVQQIVHSHQGEITVTSTESEGTRFLIHLPRRDTP